MRPRVFPAEDASSGAPPPGGCASFNEAAGIPRGRPTKSARVRSRSWSFNEAAGIPRGRHGHDGEDSPTASGFNEAAGIPRGRLLAVVPERREPLLHASMRPRVFPAEDSILDDEPDHAPFASMRPRVFPAEDVPEAVPRTWQVARFNEAAGIPRGRLEGRYRMAAGGEGLQ